MELFSEKMSMEEILAIPTLTLAHIGDGVYELLARCHVVHERASRVEAAHKRTVGMVRAGAQARAAELLLPRLSEEETAYFMRGRNAQPHSVPKNSTRKEYAYATGLETLFGMLYLSGRERRIRELWELILESADEGI
ncbi:MAG: ribonuclease III [Clostridia bacterium]|nr:ribonuclease III [Clostridia bacterium]